MVCTRFTYNAGDGTFLFILLTFISSSFRWLYDWVMNMGYQGMVDSKSIDVSYNIDLRGFEGPFIGR